MNRWRSKALWVLMAVLVTVSFSVVAGQKAWEKINWNGPVPWPERLLADHYILPEGWQEATEGVTEITFINSGGLRHDIATFMNMLRFEELTGIKVKAIEIEPGGPTTAKSISVIVTKDSSIHGLDANDPTYYLAPIVATGGALPIDFMWPVEVRQLYNPNLETYLGWDGHYYILPVTYIGHPIFYRPSWLEDADLPVPSSFAEMYDVLKVLREARPEGEYPLTFIGGSGDIFDVFRPLLYSQGARLFADGKFQFDTPEAKNAFAWMVNAVKEGLAPEAVLNYNWSDSGNFFGTGKAGFIIGNPTGYLSAYKTRFPIAEDFDLMAPPKWSPETPDEYAGGATVGCNSIVVNKYADDKHIAALLLFGDYLRSLEAQRNELFVEGNDSGLIYLWENLDEQIQMVDWNLANKAADQLGIPPVPPVTTLPFAEARKVVALNAVFEIYPPAFAEIQDRFLEVFAQAVRGELSVDEAMKTMQEFADTIW